MVADGREDRVSAPSRHQGGHFWRGYPGCGGRGGRRRDRRRVHHERRRDEVGARDGVRVGVEEVVDQGSQERHDLVFPHQVKDQIEDLGLERRPCFDGREPSPFLPLGLVGKVREPPGRNGPLAVLARLKQLELQLSRVLRQHLDHLSFAGKHLFLHLWASMGFYVASGEGEKSKFIWLRKVRSHLLPSLPPIPILPIPIPSIPIPIPIPSIPTPPILMMDWCSTAFMAWWRRRRSGEGERCSHSPKLFPFLPPRADLFSQPSPFPPILLPIPHIILIPSIPSIPIGIGKSVGSIIRSISNIITSIRSRNKGTPTSSSPTFPTEREDGSIPGVGESS